MPTSSAKGDKNKSIFRNKSPTERWKQLEDLSDEKISLQHYQFCIVLMFMAFFGALSMQMGLSIGPDDCDNDNSFESMGGLVLWISAIGIPINGIIFLRSFFDYDMNTARIFLWSITHIAVLIVILVLFIDAVAQDMFCGSGGPHYDIGAGF